MPVIRAPKPLDPTTDPIQALTTVRLGGRHEKANFLPQCQRLLVSDPLPSKQEFKEGKRIFYVPTEDAGDERLTWDARFLNQIQGAKKDFDDLIARGMIPFRVDANGKKTAEPMYDFDPNAEEVVFAPLEVPRMVVGG